MEEYLERTIQKLRKEAPRRFRDLRSSCDAILNDKQDTDQQRSFSIEPLVLSCATHHPRLMEIAIDGFHYIIEHGILTGLKMEKTITEDQSLVLSTSIVEAICKCSDEFDEGVQLQVIKALLVAVTSLQFEMHEANLLLAVRACFQIHLTSKNAVIKTTAKAALTQMISIVYQRMESYDSNLPQGTTGGPVEVDEPVVPEESGASVPFSDAFESVYQKDAYLLFRALCKLSTKGVSDEVVTGSDAVIHQNKVLSLELIHHLLRNCGPLFKRSFRFINAIKTFLCNSLLSNCTSSSPQVTGLALQIFVLLVQDFKEHLKAEMEVFISSIFLRILESEYSTYDHKSRVLEVLHLIFADPQAQLELFVNYDCDMNATNIFSRIVASLARLTKNSAASSNAKMSVEFISSAKKQQSEDGHLRCMGLDGLVIMLRSLKGLAFRGDTVDDTESKSPVSSSEPAGELDRNGGLDGIVALDAQSVDEGGAQIGIDVFDKKVKLERDLELGILNFNLNPMKGLKYLASKQILVLEPFEIAHFLTEYNDRLDKTAVGDFLGREREYQNGLCYAVLHEFVKLMDFSDMDFVSAIRLFLSGFRLPGEAQKIDRIMEKFAEKYYLQHKEDFANADMAFILAFSTIMLQTNLHNPAIKDDKRMTKEQFIKQNKGISSDGELSDEILVEIFDRIAAEPISLQSDLSRKPKKEDNSFVVFSGSVDRKKKDAFNSERKEMVRQSEALIRQKKTRASVFVKTVSTNDDVYVKSMFEVVWPPVLGAISFVLDSEEDHKLTELSLAAFDLCISLACKLDVPIARNTFINALTKFTSLDTVKEMKVKQVACIKLLLHVAVTWGDSLEESWNQILLSISQLARLQLFVGSQNDDPFFSDTSTNGSHRRSSRAVSDKSSSGGNYSDPVTKFFLGVTKAESIRIIEEGNAEFLSQNIDPAFLDRIFVSSTKLSGASVNHFVKSLCLVSLQEMSNVSSMMKSKDSWDADSPRIFSLQKLVEVADYNMTSRSRVDWTNMWNVLAKHFCNVGLHENLAVAMYAIDSLKQLSIKFLQKEELSNFNFQRLFLRPFEVILSRTPAVEIKDLILRCIDIMIKACAQNIRSGWRTIFFTLELAAAQDQGEIAKLSFSILEGLLNDKFELIKHDFVELMNCLVGFGSCQHTALSLKAINYLIVCGAHLAEGRVNPSVEQHSASDTRELSWESFRDESMKRSVEGDSAVFRLWWPLLLGLSTRVSDLRPSVRNEALQALKRVLVEHGHIFSAQTWAVIFKGVLYPIIDNAKYEGSEVEIRSASPNVVIEKQNWIEGIAEQVLTFCIECYCTISSRDESKVMFRDLLAVLSSCVVLCIPTLSSIALSSLQRIVFSLGDQGSSLTKIVCDSLYVETLCNHETEIVNGCLNFDFLSQRNVTFRLPSNCSPAVATTLLRLQKQGSASEVKTKYGTGRIIGVASIEGSKRKMLKVELPWGILFAPSDESEVLQTSNGTSPSSNLSTEAKFSVLKSILQQLVGLLDEMLLSMQFRLEESEFDQIIRSVEAIYWYCYLFNRDHLRNSLLAQSSGGRSNSSGLLNFLLEVELAALQTMLKWSFALYIQKNKVDDSPKTKHESRGERLRRFIEIACDGYRQVAHGDADDDGDDEDSGDEDELEGSLWSTIKRGGDSGQVQSQIYNVYISSIKLVVGALLEFSEFQFGSNRKWLLPILSSLIICDDLSLRRMLRKVYEKYVNVVLSAGS